MELFISILLWSLGIYAAVCVVALVFLGICRWRFGAQWLVDATYASGGEAWREFLWRKYPSECILRGLHIGILK